MHQSGVHLAAGQGQVAHRQGVDLEGGLRLLLGHVHLVVGGGVEHHFGVEARQCVLHRGRVRDVHLGTVPRHRPQTGVAAVRGPVRRRAGRPLRRLPRVCS